MARGSEPNSTVSTREQRTEELLTLLTDAEGADRVMLGTNFAGWDQEDDIVRRVSGLGLDAVRLEAVLGGTATRWFGLPVGG